MVRLCVVVLMIQWIEWFRYVLQISVLLIGVLSFCIMWVSLVVVKGLLFISILLQLKISLCDIDLFFQIGGQCGCCVIVLQYCQLFCKGFGEMWIVVGCVIDVGYVQLL